MKAYNPIIYILSLACAGLILSACETTGPAAAPPPNSGHVLIYRVANFGTDLSMVVSVDGKDVGSFTEGNNYNGYLPAGTHHISVRVDPNRTGARSGRKALTVQSGQTYSYTAAWSGGNLKLIRNP
ncbi:MAG: hypothetical protein ACM3NN_16170 [Nitrospirota bacterium]|jgi:hypothetical protein